MTNQTQMERRDSLLQAAGAALLRFAMTAACAGSILWLTWRGVSAVFASTPLELGL